MNRSKILSLGVLVGLSLSAWGQSTDPNNPTPWTGYGVNARGTGREITYYYRVTSPPGLVQAHVRAMSGSGGVSLSFFNADRAPLGGARSTPGSDGNATLSLTRREPMLMALRLEPGVGDYSCWIDLPRAQPVSLPRPEDNVRPEALQAAASGRLSPAPPASPPAQRWEMSGSGDAVARDYYYPVTVYPGDFSLQVQCQARYFSTGVTLDLEDEHGNSLRRVGAIATTSPTTERATWHCSERRSLRVHVRVLENCLNYNWAIEGPLER